MKGRGAPCGASRLEAAKRRLGAARPTLLARSYSEILEPLCELLDEIRDSRSPSRRELETRLSTTSGFAAATLREGLARGLAPWSGDALRELVRRELTPALAGGRRRLAPFSRTAVVLGGVIPMPTILQCLVPLLLRSPVLVRCAAHDRVTAPWLADLLRKRDPELARCIEVVAFSHDDAACLRDFLDAECVVASGSDATLTALARQRRAHQRWQGYGHRVSLALLGPGATRGAALAQAAAGLALDISLWDQLGCLSPLAVFVLDPEARCAAGRVAERLAKELAIAVSRLAPGAIDLRAATLVRRESAEAEMRAAGGQDVAVHGGSDAGFTVVREEDARWRPAPQHRFVRVHPLADLDALQRALEPLAPQLAAVAVAGLESGAGGGGYAPDEIAMQLATAGASRLCVAGEMQSPPLGWHHDGQPVLLPLARFCDHEADS